MTCIVGLVHEGITYIGGDSLGSNGHSKTFRKDKKVFHLKDLDQAIGGYTSSYRMGQLLMYCTGLFDQRDKDIIDHEYMVTRMVPNLITLFDAGGYTKTNNGQKYGGKFLLGYRDSLYQIDSDFQVAESADGYDAVGSGEEFALGSLHATQNLGLSPEERINLALEAASHFSCSVGGDFHIVSTANKGDQ